MRAASLSPERRREIATLASAAAVEARKRIPKKKRSEMAKKAAAKRWGKKRGRPGVALDAMPPNEGQFSSDPAEGETQNMGVGGASIIPNEAGGAVPDGIATVRDVYTDSQQLRQQQTQPPVPELDRSSWRPLGPGDCMIHASTQRCQKCGATVTPVHIMMRLIGGSFCEKCCPACHPAS
jgi:hypothetical protein